MIEEPFICRLDRKAVSHQFAVNRTWKDIWVKYYGEDYHNLDLESYVKMSWKILEDCGFTYIVERYSDNPNSSVYSAVKEITVFRKNNILDRIEIFDRAYSNCVEQALIQLIAVYRVNMAPYIDTESKLANTLTASRKYLSA